MAADALDPIGGVRGDLQIGMLCAFLDTLVNGEEARTNPADFSLPELLMREMDEADDERAGDDAELAALDQIQTVTGMIDRMGGS